MQSSHFPLVVALVGALLMACGGVRVPSVEELSTRSIAFGGLPQNYHRATASKHSLAAWRAQLDEARQRGLIGAVEVDEAAQSVTARGWQSGPWAATTWWFAPKRDPGWSMAYAELREPIAPDRVATIGLRPGEFGGYLVTADGERWTLYEARPLNGYHACFLRVDEGRVVGLLVSHVSNYGWEPSVPNQPYLVTRSDLAGRLAALAANEPDKVEAHIDEWHLDEIQPLPGVHEAWTTWPRAIADAREKGAETRVAQAQQASAAAAEAKRAEAEAERAAADAEHLAEAAVYQPTAPPPTPTSSPAAPAAPRKGKRSDLDAALKQLLKVAQEDGLTLMQQATGGAYVGKPLEVELYSNKLKERTYGVWIITSAARPSPRCWAEFYSTGLLQERELSRKTIDMRENAATRRDISIYFYFGLFKGDLDSAKFRIRCFDPQADDSPYVLQVYER